MVIFAGGALAFAQPCARRPIAPRGLWSTPPAWQRPTAPRLCDAARRIALAPTVISWKRHGALPAEAQTGSRQSACGIQHVDLRPIPMPVLRAGALPPMCCPVSAEAASPLPCEPSTIRLQSPASSIELRACLSGCVPFPRGQILLPVCWGTCPCACPARHAPKSFFQPWWSPKNQPVPIQFVIEGTEISRIQFLWPNPRYEVPHRADAHLRENCANRSLLAESKLTRLFAQRRTKCISSRTL